MGPLGIACAAVAILLSAAACMEQQSADRRPHSGTVPERPAAEGAVAGPVPGERKKTARPVVMPREQWIRAADVPVAGRDTWERMRHLMTMVPVRPDVSSLREFRRKIRRYHGNQHFFDSLGDRARPWLYHVAREVARRGMPGEIALLPAVESGYDARAVSAREAAGLWQILPGTARELDLARSWWYDARHDTPVATVAALDYLTSLREDFNDDWMLAVAAYNCGPGNVRRAIRRAGLEIETADYAPIERYLPNETRNHMARWLVFSEIVATPRLHNVRLKTIPWRPYFTEISVRSQTDLAAAARLAGVSLAEISVLNFGIRRGMTAPNGPHRLLLPAEHAQRVGRELSRLPPVQLAERQRHRIRQGDTLGSIARAHGTTVVALMAANHLDSHLIRAGRELMIPAPHGAPSATPEVHIVSPGESLWIIARQYQTTISSLRGWNRLAPGSNLLRPGQQLRIRGEG